MKNDTIYIMLMLCVGFVGCKQQEEATAEMTVDATEISAEVPETESLTVTDAMSAQLTSADAADGTTDHVIDKCVMCRLGMDGKAEFAATVGDYTVHLCSSMCLEGFKKDPSKALLALAEE